MEQNTKHKSRIKKLEYGIAPIQNSKFKIPYSTKSTQRGFTMIELIIVVAIVAIIGVGGIGSLRNLGKSAELSSTVKVIEADLRLMQAKAMIGEGGRMWGVRFVNSTPNNYYVLFSIVSGIYGDASMIVSATTTLMKGIAFSDPASGIKDIIFSKISGATVSTTVVIVSEGKFATTSIPAVGTIFTILPKQGAGAGVATPDDIPTAFSFTDQTGVALSTFSSSNILQITGIDVAVSVSISDTGSPQFRTCSDSLCGTEIRTWGSGATTITNNQFLQLRLNSSGSGGTALSATITVGTGSDNWSVTTAVDDTPNTFSFTDQTGVTLSTLISSNILQISGIAGSVPVSISGNGSPQFRTCSDSGCSTVLRTWETAATTITNNQFIQLRLTSSGSNSTAFSATITVGTGSDNWSVTTVDDTPNAFSFTDQTGVTLSTLIPSNILQIAGIDVEVSVSISGSGSPQFRTCSNSNCTTEIRTWGSDATTITNNQYLQLRLTSSGSNGTTNSANIAVGTGSDNWSVTTVAPADDTPTAFSFTDQTGVTLSTLIESNILQISGIDVAVSVSISGSSCSPQFRTCSDSGCSSVIQTWGSSPQTITNNQYLQLRGTSSVSSGTTLSPIITVGTGSDIWSITTVASTDDTPTEFSFTDQTRVASSTLISSNILQIAGIDVAVSVSISGTGSPQFRTCSDSDCTTVIRSFGTGATTITNNQYLQLRLTSTLTNATEVSATITVGTGSDNWGVTTIDGFSVQSGTVPPLGIAGMTLIMEGSQDDANLQVSLPFSFPYYGVARLVFIGSNSYLSFGAGSSAFSGLSCTNPGRALHVGSADNSWQRYYWIDNGNGSVRVRFEGTNSTSGTVGSPTIVWEATIYDDGKIQVAVGSHNRSGGISNMSNGVADASCLTYTLAQNQSHVSAPSGGTYNIHAGSSVVGNSSAEDNILNAFSFTDQTGVATSVRTLSNILQISGFNTAPSVSISGTGSPQFRICANSNCSANPAWGSSARTITNNQWLQLRLTSSGSANTTNSANIAVGTGSDNWSVYTGVYPTTGGTITNSGGFTIHTFTSNGTFTPSVAMNVEVLVVAGGGGGGADVGGGGGAGGLLTNSSFAVTASSTAVTVGAGGARGQIINTEGPRGYGYNGGNSVFSTLTATGGGGGGNYNSASAVAGGSGGGGGGAAGAGASGTAGQGNRGGNGSSSAYASGGGGGAGAAGQSVSGIIGGSGGNGLSVGISGTSTWYAGGGGGGGGNDSSSDGRGYGGSGGGGTGSARTGAFSSIASTRDGAPNTGGGGGGTGGWNTAGNGGSGIVIIRYLTSPGVDNTPTAFSFTDQTGVEFSNLISSNILQITGIDMATAVSISGDGTPAFRICADSTCSTSPAWGTSASTITNNQYLQIRLTSSGSLSTALSATITVGTGSDSWSVTTAAQVSTFTYTYTDTNADNVTANSLFDFLTALTVTTSHFIFFEVVAPTATANHGAWCSERADSYRTNYIAGSSFTSGNWNKWHRAQGGAWSEAVTTGYSNTYSGCDGFAYSWCSEWGLGSRYLGTMPGNTVSSESYANTWSGGASWVVTIKVSGTRAGACGF